MDTQDTVVDLFEARRDMGALVGGKAANLGELTSLGERVPPGFCVTTAAYASGTVPSEAITRAYAALGGGKVAVRSSATAEDLPDAGFAGQQDTYLDIEGADAVVGAVRRCWGSLDNERAVAYREANGIDRADVRMAVVVQRMVDAATAGVMFTADPLTGTRTRTVVDAVRGPGTGSWTGRPIPTTTPSMPDTPRTGAATPRTEPGTPRTEPGTPRPGSGAASPANR